mmetsp:Transcript_94603/g.262819  ORF Transcript_94603/g.262819 Transcript_94603/m.262819 type:complete len:275 (+) Transcript_94603:1184-2008(+)
MSSAAASPRRARRRARRVCSSPGTASTSGWRRRCRWRLWAAPRGRSASCRASGSPRLARRSARARLGGPALPPPLPGRATCLPAARVTAARTATGARGAPRRARRVLWTCPPRAPRRRTARRPHPRTRWRPHHPWPCPARPATSAQQPAPRRRRQKASRRGTARPPGPVVARVAALAAPRAARAAPCVPAAAPARASRARAPRVWAPLSAAVRRALTAATSAARTQAAAPMCTCRRARARAQPSAARSSRSVPHRNGRRMLAGNGEATEMHECD